MNNFLDADFLLQTDTAKELYHHHAAKMPIIDYHSHLSPKMVAEDHRFQSITEVWLGGDHYKWRALRTNGINEEYITGNASNWEKFEAWAKTVPYTMRNPLYHWTHLELKTAFGIEKLLSPKTARDIYDDCNSKLQSPEYSARNLMRKYNVQTICTTDDPIDSLEYHKQCKNDGFEIKILPTWRPDKAMALEKPTDFRNYIDTLATVAGTPIRTFDEMMEALQIRHDFFAQMGCKLSDHGLTEFYAADYTESEIKRIFKTVYDGKKPSQGETVKFKSAMLVRLGEMDWASGWAQQFHYGVIRNNNSRLFKKLGADSGFDSIATVNTASQMATFFDRLDRNNRLAKTIIYNLNPSDNEMLATMIGNFQDGSVAGKMQYGSGWWFLDQKEGIERQLNALSALGLLSRFVGMLTDSRSFLSYPRHEYFRRVLCNLIGNDVEKGLLPHSELEFIGKMVEDISYYNAKNFFKF